MKYVKKLLLLTLKSIFLAPLALVFIVIGSEGWRMLFPSQMGMRLSRIPGFAVLDRYEWSHRLDFGHFIALATLIFLSALWGGFIKAIIVHDLAQAQTQSKLDVFRHRTLLYLVAIPSILAEAGLFFLGVQQASWGANASFAAALATMLYVLMTFGANYIFVVWTNE